MKDSSQNIFIFLFVLLLTSSCINLREPYPSINYYTLNQEPTMLGKLQTSDKVVLLRRITVNEALNSPQILITTNKTNIQRLFYHRWISDVSSLTDDFIATRLNKSGLLSNGVIRSSSAAYPDYIIEPHLINMVAHSSLNNVTEENFVTIEIKVDLLRRDTNNNLQIVHSNTYKQTYIRNNQEIKYISDAYSKIFSITVDNIIADLSNILN